MLLVALLIAPDVILLVLTLTLLVNIPTLWRLMLLAVLKRTWVILATMAVLSCVVIVFLRVHIRLTDELVVLLVSVLILESPLPLAEIATLVLAALVVSLCRVAMSLVVAKLELVVVSDVIILALSKCAVVTLARAVLAIQSLVLNLLELRTSLFAQSAVARELLARVTADLILATAIWLPALLGRIAIVLVLPVALLIATCDALLAVTLNVMLLDALIQLGFVVDSGDAFVPLARR